MLSRACARLADDANHPRLTHSGECLAVPSVRPFQFRAACDGAMNIDPQAWTSVTGGDRTRFPAQVRVDIVEKCAPLKEADFAHVFPAYGRLPSEMTHDEVQELNACFDKKAAARKGPPKQQPPRQPETPQRQQPHPAPQRSKTSLAGAFSHPR